MGRGYRYGGGGGYKIGEVTIRDKSNDSKFLLCNGEETIAENLIDVLPHARTETGTWTLCKNVFGKSYVNGVTYGKGLFVAVGDNGKLATSPDGITWILKETGCDINAYLKCITYGNGLFVAFGRDGEITSPDGITWTLRIGIFPTIAVVFVNGLFMAVGVNEIATSPDGITWTLRTGMLGTNVAIKGVIYGKGLFVAVGDNGKLATSPDGITWTLRTSNASDSLNGITFAKNKFIAVGRKEIVTSNDGINWVKKDTVSYSLNSIIYSKGIFVAGGISGMWKTSLDGDTWTHWGNSFYNEMLSLSSDGNIVVSAMVLGEIATNSNIGEYVRLPSYAIPAYIRKE